MRIKLMLMTETCRDGVGKHVADIVRYIDKEKFEVMVLYGVRRKDYYFDHMMEECKSKVTFVAIPSFNREIHPGDDVRAWRAVRRYIMSFSPDIIHCHSAKAGAIGRLSSLFAKSVKALYYTPHAYAIQNPHVSSLKRILYTGIEQVLSRRAKVYTLNVSYGEKEFALEKKLAVEKRTEVVYNGIEDDSYKTQDHMWNSIQERPFVVGCVARLYEQKNPYQFLKIAKAAQDKVTKEISFIWIGEGELFEEIKEYAKKTLPKSLIKFYGSRENIGQELQKMDIFLSTALYEGLPYTLIEACRAGLPIVATDIVGNRECVKTGNDGNGFLYKLDSIDQALDGIRALYEDASLYKNYSEKSRQIYLEKFELSAMISKLENIYTKSFVANNHG